MLYHNTVHFQGANRISRTAGCPGIATSTHFTLITTHNKGSGDKAEFGGTAYKRKE